MSGLRSLFGGSSKKDNDGATSPTPGGKNSKDKRRSDRSYGMSHIQEYTSRDDPRHGYRIRSTLDPRSNGQFIDMRSYGYPSHHAEPEFVRSRLMSQFQETLNAKLNEGIRKACLHWDDEVLTLENNYNNILAERNEMKGKNKDLANRVKALEKEVNDKVALLKEFQAGHMKSSGTRRLAPSSSTIQNDFEALEKRIRDTVFSRVARLSIHDPHIQVLMQHQPFLEAVKGIMCNVEETQGAENVPLGLMEVVEESEKKGLLMFMIQGVIHDILYKKVMTINMPGLDENELKVLGKIYEAISRSEGDQGTRIAQQWRADTFRKLAYWAENVEELSKHVETSPAVGEIAQVFRSIIDGAEKEIFRVLAPFCDPETPEGESFSRIVVDIVDRAFAFSILIGSQLSRYEIHRNIKSTDDFQAVPEHLENPNSENVPLFYAVPALIKTSGEDGEAYETPEPLVQGKIYVLFGIEDLIDDEDIDEDEPAASSQAQEKPLIKMASPVNGTEDLIESIGSSSPEIISRDEAMPPNQQSAAKTEISKQDQESAMESGKPAEGAATLPNPSMTNYSEIIVSGQELIVKESNEEAAATSEDKDAIAKTTSAINENATPKDPEAASTTTNQKIPDQENQDSQLQSILPSTKTTEQLLEPLPSSSLPSLESSYQSLEAHLTESPALPKDNLLPSLPPAQTHESLEAAIAATLTEINPADIAKREPVKEAEAETVTTLPTLSAGAKEQEGENNQLPPPSEMQMETSSKATPSSTLTTETPSPNEHELQTPLLTSSNSTISLAQSTPRSLPIAPVSLLNRDGDSKKAAVAVTEERAVGVETI
ncbi:hypothetical protein AA313_de0206545 [Arthrobotrys entomopaga]|nr:hypothetical protein AA313_de0206545 [Arthrobotrys entomopaga]